MFEPAYVKLHKTGELKKRISEAYKLLQGCCVCPRKCGIDRLRQEQGFCRTGRFSRVASFAPHFGEESTLVGSHGSGTIFFSSCNLLCTFCQNYDISHFNAGTIMEPPDLAAVMIRLAKAGCHNINFVTPTHVVPQILEALPLAIEAGLHVPLVYNTGGYDCVETLKLLGGIFDIYMPDFKFWDAEYAAAFCSAPDYPSIARAAIKEMHSQVGDLVTDHSGIACRGLLVRHLVMPEGIAGSKHIMGFIAEEISRNTYVNIMDQYRPCYKAIDDAIISRRISREEYSEVVESAIDAGLTRLDTHGGPRLF